MIAQNCFTQSEKIVKGSSMEPLFYEGDTITSLLGYYDCNPVARDDIVLADYGGASFGIILKTVKALPGDTLSLHETNEGSNILVNGKILATSNGVKYTLPSHLANILKSYELDSGGVVPAGNYLIFGEKPTGSFDSTRSGFFTHKQIIAKVLSDEK